MPYAPVLRCAVAVLLSAAAAPVAAADDGWSLAPSASAPGGRPYVYAEGANEGWWGVMHPRGLLQP
ncbi:hypothetical protein ACFWIZ_55840, partial [Streptomyces sp. NPDC127044]